MNGLFKDHWEHVYETRAADAVSWYQPHATVSLRLIRGTKLGKDAAIIDVGGGASILVDDLVADGYSRVTVLDISQVALDAARRRLGVRARQVQWLAADITRIELPLHGYDLWHDRAVFHFLITPEARAAYVRAMIRAVKPDGHAIIATFSEDGPTHCSGLPVVRYRPEELQRELGAAFSLASHEQETHHTPGGAVQSFVYCCFRKAA